MTDPEDPARTAAATLTQTVAVATTSAELLASTAAQRAADRADAVGRQAAATRAQARAEQAAGRLAFDACGDPMPSATAVLVSPPSAASRGGERAEGGQVIDGQVVARAYPVPQTAQTTAAAAAAAAARPSAGGVDAVPAGRVTAAVPARTPRP
jgi:hypothetical protein